jgi:chromosome segregation ATPase
MPTLEEIGAQWGIVHNQALATSIRQEKQLAARAETIRQLTASKAVLENTVEDLEAYIAELKNEILDLRQVIEEQREAADNNTPDIETNDGGKIIKAIPGN